MDEFAADSPVDSPAVLDANEFAGADNAADSPRPARRRRGRPREETLQDGDPFLAIVVASSTTGLWRVGVPPHGAECVPGEPGRVLGAYIARWRLLGVDQASHLAAGYAPGEWLVQHARKLSRRYAVYGLLMYEVLDAVQLEAPILPHAAADDAHMLKHRMSGMPVVGHHGTFAAFLTHWRGVVDGAHTAALVDWLALYPFADRTARGDGRFFHGLPVTK